MGKHHGTAGGHQVRRIVSIGAGKGGVGTSMIATNLGIFLAQIGKRVVLIDADLPSPGLHAWLGRVRPTRTIADVLRDKYDRLEDVITETSITGLFLVAGTGELMGDVVLDDRRRDRLLGQIRDLEADVVLIDLPSGLSALAVDLFGRADVSIAVTVGTPDSVESTYRLICAAFLRAMMRSPAVDPEARSVLEALGSRPGRPPTPRQIIDDLAPVGGNSARAAATLAATFHPQLIVNQTRIKADEELGRAMVSAAVRWIGLVPRLLGSVGWDDNVWLALRRGLPLLIDFPRSRACKDLEQIVRRMHSQEYKELFAPTHVPPRTEEQNLYELLEIYPGASEEEVRRALKQIHEWYGADGLAGRGACTEEEGEDYERRAEEAHARLLDRSRRREYDRSNFPDGFPSARDNSANERSSIAGTVAATRDSLPRVDLNQDQFVDGAFLGRLRMERNVELVDISNRAKISVAYLKAIEEERFADLPAPVFIRGFVTEYARFLKIDPRRAVNDFMAKYEANAERRGK